MEDVEDMEELAMSASKIERKAEKAKREKRDNIRKLKRLAGIDEWNDEDSISISDSEDTLVNFLKFLKDPMIKLQFDKADFRVIHNALVDAIKIIEKFEMKEEADLLVKIK